MQAKDLMTRDPACCTPDQTLEEVARMMKQHDCGCIPVVENEQNRRVVGLVTDRDLATRALAEGLGSATVVETVMSSDPVCCSPETDVAEIERLMSERQVRRIPVEDGEGCCVGIIAQADLALAEDRGISDREVGRVVEQISRPTRSGKPGPARPATVM